MDISCFEDERGLIATVSGRLDTLTAPDFDKACSGWVEEGRRKMVLDLSSLEYISSAGLRSILAMAKKLATCGGVLAICSVSGVVAEVFSISGFDSFLPVFEDRDGALESLK